MPVECVHPLERLAATFTLVGSIVEVKSLMAFAVVSPSKSFSAAGPLALERFLFVV